MSVRTFWCEETGMVRRSLRHFSYDRCPRRGSHDAIAPLDEADVLLGTTLTIEDRGVDHHDPRWPTHCACGYAFAPSDQWQVFPERLYQRADDGAVITLRDAPPGATYDARWRRDLVERSPDGIVLTVVLPDRSTWHPDDRAANCTIPSDHAHRCWCRHGDARWCTWTRSVTPAAPEPAASWAAVGGTGFLPAARCRSSAEQPITR